MYFIAFISDSYLDANQNQESLLVNCIGVYFDMSGGDSGTCFYFRCLLPRVCLLS